LEALEKAYAAGQLRFFGDLEPLRDPQVFARYLAPLAKRKGGVYAKAPWGGPQQVLEYLGRYTHRMAISNRRLLTLKDGQLANGHRADKLKLCRQLLATPCSQLLPGPADYRNFAALTGTDLRRYPQCGIGTMRLIEVLLPGQVPWPVDTS
jgi:hypothetical protein